MVHRKVDSYFSCKVPRLEERIEAEENSDGDDDGVNNRTSKGQAVVSLKKDHVFRNVWLSNKSQRTFCQASHGSRLILTLLSSCRAPIFQAGGPWDPPR